MPLYNKLLETYLSFKNKQVVSLAEQHLVQENLGLTPRPLPVRVSNASELCITELTHLPLVVTASAEPDGSSSFTTTELVHPSVIMFDRPWNGYLGWGMIEPYPGEAGTDDYENPSVIVFDGKTWIEHPLVSNPVLPRPAGVLFQADAGLSFDEANNRLVCTWRESIGSSNGEGRLMLSYSYDGINWSPRQLLFSETGTYINSPKLVPIVNNGNTSWRLYYATSATTNAMTLRYRSASDIFGDSGGWSTKLVTNCTISPMPYAENLRRLWDFQIYWADNQFTLCHCTSNGIGGSAANVYLSTSTDGINFVCSPYALRRASSAQDKYMGKLVYTTALYPDPNEPTGLVAFVSGMANDPSGPLKDRWSVALGKLTRIPVGGLPAGASEIFSWDHQFGASPSSGVVTSIDARCPQGSLSPWTNIVGSPTHETEGVRFVGDLDYVQFNTNKPFSSLQEWTVAVRSRTVSRASAGRNGERIIFSLGNCAMMYRADGAGVDSIALSLITGGQLTPNSKYSGSGIAYNTDEWNTHVLSYDGKYLRAWSTTARDLGISGQITFSSWSLSPGLIIGGGANNNPPYTIDIAWLRIWDRATLRPEEVSRFLNHI